MENYRLFLLFLIAALAVGFTSVVFVLRWVFYFKEGLAWDGGLAEFNWHPVLILTGFIYIQGIAIVVYRLPWTWRCSKLMMKFIHAGLHSLAFILVVIALVAVFDFHNEKRIPNMYSLHSWVGLAAVVLYALQLVLGLCVYLIPVTPLYLRAAFMPLHIYSGLFIFSSAIATSLMGITEKLIFGLKDPKYSDSPAEATFVNVLGVLLTLFGALILWLTTHPSWKRPGEHQQQSRLSEQEASADLPVGSTLSTLGSTDKEACCDTQKRHCEPDGPGQ
uniref:Plasma membrane ascorbate-dependent reductase CYBRD1 n=1 Tax=Paramormyrops kingsleyae TaxID=1676925 RepID=A0A3B3RVQ6_9TELE|nr:cytochrome b reductase 1 [Paramormyrops kingsleyae]